MEFLKVPYKIAEQGIAPEQLPEMAYHIKHEWGVLQVSSGAEKAYGFTPFSATEKGSFEGNSERTKELPLMLNVIMLSPQESQFPPIGISDNATSVQAKSMQHKRGVDLVLSLDRTLDDDVEGRVELIKSVYSRNLPREIEEDELPKTPEGESVRDSLRANLPQDNIHMLQKILQESLAHSVNESLKIVEANDFYNTYKKLGGIGLTAAGVSMLGFSLTEGRLSLNGVIAAGTLLATNSYQSVKLLRVHLRNQPYLDEMKAQIANSYANKVADDFHNTYCSAHFDRAMEADLRSSDR